MFADGFFAANLLFGKLFRCGLPCNTSAGRYLLFSPQIGQTTRIALEGNPFVPEEMSWPHCLQHTTQDLGIGSALIERSIGEEKGKIKLFGIANSIGKGWYRPHPTDLGTRPGLDRDQHPYSQSVHIDLD
jgi:hypothetical protein